MEKLVSIVMPCFNGEKTLGAAIQSVLQQSYSNWELLIYDDCSTDNSVAIVQEYKRIESRIKFFHGNKNLGAAKARNYLIEKALGSFIAFLDSDDRWISNKLYLQIQFMEENDLCFTYTSYISISKSGSQKLFRPPPKVSYNKLLYSNSIGCSTAVYSAEKLGKKYMPNIRKRQDFGLWLEILKITEYAYRIDEPLTLYAQGPKSLSGNKLSAARYQWMFYRSILSFGIFRSIWYFGWYTFFGALKHWI